MRKILVTGGAGYIGSHACKALAAAGYEPVSFDNLVYGHEWAVKWGPLEVGDVSDRGRLDQVIEKYQPAAIMHFAAYAYVGESVQHPGKYYRNNVAGTLTLLEAMRDHGIRDIVFSSTCATYGVPAQVPISEVEPLKPISPYGMSKYVVERMLADFDVAHGLKSVSLRYFNAAGADEEGQVGEDHDPETHLIPLAIGAVLGTNDPLTIFGDDYPTPDGTCIRDYVHVADLAEAHVKAIEYLANGNESGVFNLGTGTGYSVKEIVDAVSQISGQQVPFSFGPRRSGDPAVLYSSTSLANEVLGWTAIHSSLDKIIGSAWNWHASRRNGK